MSYYPISPSLQIELTKKTEFNDFYNKEGLYPHQEFPRRYLSPYTPYKGLLLFHSLGSGKTLICISIAVDHYLYDKKKCIIVTKGSAGTENFKKQIELYYNMCKFDENILSKSEYLQIFIMDHYISFHNTISNLTNDNIINKYSNKILVFDEIHNVRKVQLELRNSNQKVYDTLKRVIKLTKNTKVLLATATPMTNDIDQLYSTMGLLKDEPSNFDGVVSYNAEIKYKPKKIFHGESGYLNGIKVYASYMTSHQKRYHILEKSRGSPTDIYRLLTHISLFSFPDENGHGRKIFESGIVIPIRHTKSIISMKTGLSKDIIYTFYRVVDKYRKWLKGKYLRQCSSKYWSLMEILKSNEYPKGPVFIFIEEVKGSGLMILANILEEHGYELYVGEHLKTLQKGRKRYTYCVGDLNMAPNKTDRLEGFNSVDNIDGSYVQILIGSKVIGESITLKNVRMFHMMTIHWNDSTIEQAIGRVIRSNSHNDLNPADRVVNIFIHAAIYDEYARSSEEESDNSINFKIKPKNKDENIEGTDLYKLSICNRKQTIIAKMERKLKKSAIDRYIIGRSKKYAQINTSLYSSDPSTFIRYYMDKYMDIYLPMLQDILVSYNIQSGISVNLDEIFGKINLHKIVITELIARIILQNKEIFRGLYLRENFKSLFVTDDPSLPFQFIHGRNLLEQKRQQQQQNNLNLKPNIPIYEGNINRYNIKELRNMQHLERIAYIEACYSTISNKLKSSIDQEIVNLVKENILKHFDVLFLEYNDIFYNIMCYRMPGDAYTAVLPIPKINMLQGKTRCYNSSLSKWEYILDVDANSFPKVIRDEKFIISLFEKKYKNAMKYIDNNLDVFLMISLIDNKSRIRTRGFEKTDKGDSDKRYIRKGRNLSSMLKPDLILLYNFILEQDNETEIFEPKLIENYSYTIDNYSIYDKNVKLYGFKSINEYAKNNYNLFVNFVHMMEKKKTIEIISDIENLMHIRRWFMFI